MKFLSLCSGIEAASVAWHPLGWEPVGFSEIEKFPNAVLNHHYPSVPNLGDMTRFKEWKDDLAFDLLVGGTPCQSFSVAGLRKGLDDPRGNLALTYCSIAERYQPRWLVWENVPGVLSADKGTAFASFVTALGQIGYHLAYRVLDAQYFGVPQRRKRVFVVGYLGDWRPPTAVLFEPNCSSGNTKTSRKARKGSATDSQESIGENGTKLNADKVGALLAGDYKDINSDGLMQGKAIVEAQFWNGTQIAEALTTTSNDQRMPDKGRMQMVVEPIKIQESNLYENHPNDSRVNAVDVCSTVSARWGTGGGNIPFVRETLPYDFYQITAPINRQSRQDGDPCHTLARDNASHAHIVQSHTSAMSVRRLTPIECERLQGFPDNYTRIPYGKKDAENCPDSPRYKALGNSMAVPVMAWIGRRIALWESLNL